MPVTTSVFLYMSLIVDVVIMTYKPDKTLFDLLDALMGQTIPPKKIIIMNTEEKYLLSLIFGTSFADKYKNLEIHHISKREFNHGKSRNYAARYSIAPFLIYMTQDAVPANERFIEELLRPMEDIRVSVSYARQLPKSSAGVLESFARHFNYPEESRIQDSESIETQGIKAYYCSNVSACYRRADWNLLGEFIPFTIFNEDMLFAAKAIQAGKAVYYASEAAVFHSHDYSLMKQFKRNFDLGVSQAEHPEVFQTVSSTGEGKRFVKEYLNHLKSEGKLYLLPSFLVYCAFRLCGYKMGLNFERLPKKLILSCTMNKGYWTRYWDKKYIPEDVHAGYGKNSEGL